MFNRREFSTTLALASASGLVRPRATFGNGQQSTVFDWRPIRDAMRVALVLVAMCSPITMEVA